MTIQQQERSNLNDGIEDRYLLASDYVGSILCFYENKRGTLKDEYENFFLYFARLVQITSCLEELSKEVDTINETKDWIRNKDNDHRIEARCMSGIEVFDKYTRMLSKRGLLALPSGRVR